MVPLIGVIAGTGAIGPEIDDGSVVYLLAKPVKRPTIIFTKLIVAIGVTMAFSAIPTLLAGFILNGNGQQIAVAYTVAAPVASIAYSALFLLLGTVTRHAVVVRPRLRPGLGGPVRQPGAGARTLSVQQWALALAAEGRATATLITSDVGLPTATLLLVAVTVGGHLVRGPEAAHADARRGGVTTGVTRVTRVTRAIRAIRVR